MISMISTPEIYRKLRANRLTVRFSFLPKRLSRCSTVFEIHPSNTSWVAGYTMSSMISSQIFSNGLKKTPSSTHAKRGLGLSTSHSSGSLKCDLCECASLKIELKYPRDLSRKKPWHVNVLLKFFQGKLLLIQINV